MSGDAALPALSAPDIEAIEHATRDAVPPEQVQAIDGWTLGLDSGTVNRARSAVPLRHEAPDLAALDLIEARYAEQGLRAAFRLPVLPAFDDLRAALRARGYVMKQPTRVMTGRVEALALPLPAAPVSLAQAPSAAWNAVFLGEGFDPVDGACRVGILARARHAVFAGVQAQGQTVAVGMGSFSRGWASVHGMRTLPAHRGGGLASAILAALREEARQRGLSRMFLQVEAGNTRAVALYQRIGFAPAWVYEYWSQPAD
ncbi:MAG: GNAT family N-acetyltransferase [Ramlibacter sp.]|nr:GNAT family N-acetyltransferase [Ramlibacter sp.]